MKKSIFTSALFVCTALIISTSCNLEPTNNRTETARENLKEEKLDVVEAKMELSDAQNTEYLAFKDEFEKKFKRNEESIKDLKIKLLRNDEKYRTENETRVSELEQKNFSLQKEMNGYNYDGPEKWAAFKQKFSYELDELDKAIRDFTVLS